MKVIGIADATLAGFIFSSRWLLVAIPEKEVSRGLATGRDGSITLAYARNRDSRISRRWCANRL